MTIFDHALIIILLLSIIYGLTRGVIKEILSIVGWVAAFVVANKFAGLLAPYMPDSIPGDNLKGLAALVVLFIGTLFVTGIIVSLVSSLISSVGLGWLNNFLGAVFGLLRGCLIAGVIVYLAGFTALPKADLWQNAKFSKTMENFVLKVVQYGPDFFKGKIQYPPRDALNT